MANKLQKQIKARMQSGEYLFVNIICHGDGEMSFRKYYFYTHGQTAEKWGDKVVKALESIGLKVQVVEEIDNYNVWPKDSYFNCRVQVSER